MATMTYEEQMQIETLKYMQMEALGVKRREKITTADFKENKDYVSVSQLENKRKQLGANYKPAKQNQTKISGWKNIHLTIQDDGTCDPGDLPSVNEGLGQTHRAKLMADDRVRKYSGEPDYHKTHRAHPNRKPLNPLKAVKPPVVAPPVAPAGDIRGRLLKGNPTPTTAHYRTFSPATSVGTSVGTGVGRLRRPGSSTKPTPPLTDPQDWLASVLASAQGVKKAAPKAVKQPNPEPVPKTDPLSTHKDEKANPKPAPKASMLSASKDTNAVAKPATKISSPATHKDANSDLKPVLKVNPPSTDKDVNASIAFLVSLGIKFTEEQLRALGSQIPKDAGEDTLSTLGRHEVSRPSAAQKENIADAVPKSIAKNQIAKEAALAHGPVITNGLKPKAVNQVDPMPPASQHRPVTNAADKPAVNPQNEEITLETSRSEVLRLQRDMIIGSHVYSNRYSQAAGLLVDSFRKLTLSDPNPVSSLIAQAQSTVNGKAATQSAVSVTKSAAVAPAPTPAPVPPITRATTVSEAPSAGVSALAQALAPAPPSSKPPPGPPALRPRFMPDGKPLPVPSATVSKALHAPVSAPAPAPTVSKAPSATAAALALALTPPAIKPPPGPPALEPQFIPELPPTVLNVAPLPTALASRTSNTARAVDNPFGPSRRTRRSAGPSLPPHLMGKVADPDPGAAARAQYGGK